MFNSNQSIFVKNARIISKLDNLVKKKKQNDLFVIFKESNLLRKKCMSFIRTRRCSIEYHLFCIVFPQNKDNYLQNEKIFFYTEKLYTSKKDLKKLLRSVVYLQTLYYPILELNQNNYINI